MKVLTIEQFYDKGNKKELNRLDRLEVNKQIKCLKENLGLLELCSNPGEYTTDKEILKIKFSEGGMRTDYRINREHIMVFLIEGCSFPGLGYSPILHTLAYLFPNKEIICFERKIFEQLEKHGNQFKYKSIVKNFLDGYEQTQGYYTNKFLIKKV